MMTLFTTPVEYLYFDKVRRHIRVMMGKPGDAPIANRPPRIAPPEPQMSGD
jgi:hypothetical protein